MMKWNKRPYQIECKKAIKTAYDKGINKQLIVQATGCGKRMGAIDLMNNFNRSLFIAHREELIMQPFHDIDKYWPFEVGIIKGPRFEIDKRIVVASVQTLCNRLDKINPETFDFIAVDEAHHYCSTSFLKTVRHFRPKLLTGWTATPKRLDGLNLSNIFEELIFEYGIEKGINEGYLAPIEAYQIKTPTDISKVGKTAGDFKINELSEAVDSLQRNALIVQKYQQYTPGRQGIAFCVDVDHAYNLRDAFRRAGISAETIVSDESRCPNRSELVKAFKNGEITIVTNVTILTEGFDYSDVGVGLMARPTQSETLYKQCIGRLTRLKSEEYKQKFGTNNAIILDFVDNTNKHSLINAWELEKDMPIEDRLFVPKAHKEKLIEEREKRIRKIQVEVGKDKKINLLKLPEVHVWQSEKMLEMATEAQLKWIKDLGVWEEGIEYTKAMASELISGQSAKEWQIRWLAERQYDVSGTVTQGQYQKVKWQMEQRDKYKMTV